MKMCPAEELFEALKELVNHDRASDDREGLPGCIELQFAEDLIAEIESGTWKETPQ